MKYLLDGKLSVSIDAENTDGQPSHVIHSWKLKTLAHQQHYKPTKKEFSDFYWATFESTC